MSKQIDSQKLKEKAIDLQFAARTVLQQLAMQDGSPEAMAACNLLSAGMTAVIPDAQPQPELQEQPV